MASDIKDYYFTSGYRFIILIGAVGNLGYGFVRFFLGAFIHDEYLYATAHSLLFFIIGTYFLALYIKSQHIPVAQSGIGWIIIKQGVRNRGFLRAQSRVKNIKITKPEVDYIQNGIFSLMICTQDQYRYCLYGLDKQDRKDLTRRLFSS